MQEFIFNPVFPINTSIAIAVILWVGLSILEWRRAIPYRAFRLTAVATLVLSLMTLALKPGYKSIKKIKPIALITPNYSKLILDSLRAEEELTIIASPDFEKRAGFQRLESSHAYNAIQSQIKYVLGDGLPHYLFQNPNHLNYTFFPSELRQGLVSIKMPHFIENIPGFLEGEIFSAEKMIVTLYGPEGKVDSIELNEGLQLFKFKVTPRISGEFTYRLILKKMNGDAQTENIPIKVMDGQRLNILLLQTYPTFETRYLKNYLEENGHSLLIRNELSTNIYRFETSNQPPVSTFQNLNSDLLKSFDLIIVTNEVINKWSAAVIQTVQQSIKTGLGMLIVLNNKDINPTASKAFQFDLASVNLDTTSIFLSELNESIKVNTLKNRLRNQFDFTSLYNDRLGILVGYRLSGLGKIGIQLLQGTYKLKLKSQELHYDEIWRPLITKLARTYSPAFSAQLKSELPCYPNEPIPIEILSAGESPIPTYEGIFLPVIEHSQVNQVWNTTIWPSKSGWHYIKFQDSSRFAFYVHEQNELVTLRQANQIKVNKLYSNTNSIVFNESIESFRRVSQFIPFLLILLSLGFLWVAPKL